MEEKKCTWCEEVKLLSDFYSHNKKRRDGTEYAYYHPECKECTKNAATRWRKDPKNREAFLASRRKRNQHPDRKKEVANNLAKRDMKKHAREYYRKNKKKFKAYRENRENHDITECEWTRCKEYFNYECAYCGTTEEIAKKEQSQYLHKEHVVYNGANDLSNCVPACKSCNSKKWIFKLADWYNISNEIYSITRLNKINEWLNNGYKGHE